MSASDFTSLKRDRLGNIKTVADGIDDDDVEDDRDDGQGNATRGTNDDNRLENVASMSESYSEILDSPIKSPSTEFAGAIKGSPIRIPSRRPMSLQQIASKCV